MTKLPERLVSFINSAVPSPSSNDNPLLDYLSTLGGSSVPGVSSSPTMIEVDEMFFAEEVLQSLKGGVSLPATVQNLLSTNPYGYTILVRTQDLSVQSGVGIVTNGPVPLLTDVTSQVAFFGARKKDSSTYAAFRLYPHLPEGYIETCTTLSAFREIHSKTLFVLWKYISDHYTTITNAGNHISAKLRMINIPSERITPDGATAYSIITLNNVYYSHGDFLVLVDGVVKYSAEPIASGGEATNYIFRLRIPQELVGTGNISIYGWIGAP